MSRLRLVSIGPAGLIAAFGALAACVPVPRPAARRRVTRPPAGVSEQGVAAREKARG